MRRVRTIGACVTGVLVLSAVLATAAMAVPPELGKCVAMVGGKFANSACTAPGSGKTAKFEFKAAEKKKFALALVPATNGIAATLETVGKVKITCTAGTGAGEYTGEKTASDKLKLTGCVDQTIVAKCTSTGAAEGEIVSNEFEEEFGLIVGGEKPTVGVLIKVKAPSTSEAVFVCGTVTATVEGAAIGVFLKGDSQKTIFKVKFTEAAGKQKNEKFEGGVAESLSTKLLVGTETKTEVSGFKAAATITNEEALEVKAKV
jgi:hypothetical protein